MCEQNRKCLNDTIVMSVNWVGSASFEKYYCTIVLWRVAYAQNGATGINKYLV